MWAELSGSDTLVDVDQEPEADGAAFSYTNKDAALLRPLRPVYRAW